MSNLIKRTLVGSLMVAIISLAIYLGGIYLGALLLGLSLVGLYEWTRAFSLDNKYYNYLVVSALTIMLYIEHYFNGTTIFSIGVGTTLLFGVYLFTDMGIKTLAINVLGILYVGRGFFTLWSMDSMYYVVLVFLIAFSTDTFAYMVGMTIGKHRLAPNISPNKSIEGAVGGVVGATIVTVYYLDKFVQVGFSLPFIVIFLAISSIIGQCGDLFASKIKRELRIKDYGRLLPGHGGVLDRFDSVLFIAPIIYYFYFL